MDDRPEVHSCVLLKGVGGKDLMRIRRIGHATRNQVENGTARGRNERNAQVRGIDGAAARTGRLTVIGTAKFGCRTHARGSRAILGKGWEEYTSA